MSMSNIMAILLFMCTLAYVYTLQTCESCVSIPCASLRRSISLSSIWHPSPPTPTLAGSMENQRSAGVAERSSGGGDGARTSRDAHPDEKKRSSSRRARRNYSDLPRSNGQDSEKVPEVKNEASPPGSYLQSLPVKGSSSRDNPMREADKDATAESRSERDRGRMLTMNAVGSMQGGAAQARLESRRERDGGDGRGVSVGMGSGGARGGVMGRGEMEEGGSRVETERGSTRIVPQTAPAVLNSAQMRGEMPRTNSVGSMKGGADSRRESRHERRGASTTRPSRENEDKPEVRGQSASGRRESRRESRRVSRTSSSQTDAGKGAADQVASDEARRERRGQSRARSSVRRVPSLAGYDLSSRRFSLGKSSRLADVICYAHMSFCLSVLYMHKVRRVAKITPKRNFIACARRKRAEFFANRSLDKSEREQDSIINMPATKLERSKSDSDATTEEKRAKVVCKTPTNNSTKSPPRACIQTCNAAY